MSFIFGLVIMSIIAIIPFDAIYDTITIITSILSFLFAVSIELLNKTIKKVQ